MNPYEDAILWLHNHSGEGVHVSNLVGIINVLTFAKVWQGTFDYFGVPLLAVIVAIPVGFVALCILLGVFEERSGIWGDDTLHQWAVAGWNPVELAGAVKRIEQKLEEMT